MKLYLSSFYTVQEGDTLDIIAKKYNISPIKILIYNKISPLYIIKNKILYIKN